MNIIDWLTANTDWLAALAAIVAILGFVWSLFRKRKTSKSIEATGGSIAAGNDVSIGGDSNPAKSSSSDSQENSYDSVRADDNSIAAGRNVSVKQ